MFNSRRKFLTGVFAALLALAGLASFAINEVQAKDPPQTRVEGTLTAKNVVARRMVVRLQNGTTRTLVIPFTAKIERNDVTASLNSFKIGDRVQARLLVNGTTVIKFEGVGP